VDAWEEGRVGNMHETDKVCSFDGVCCDLHAVGEGVSEEACAHKLRVVDVPGWF